ncbi:MAG: CNNM domain-containing protein, partial [Chlorobiales bacterium]|nr:CNNM domain-containing protein [Chlorobiales bacterium]
MTLRRAISSVTAITHFNTVEPFETLFIHRHFSARHMNSDIVELFILFGLILANGFFAMAEFAIISSRETKLHELRDAGIKKASL